MNTFDRIRVYFNLRPDLEEEQAIIEEVTRGVSYRGANLWILIAAIFIASLGLNVNSTAVNHRCDAHLPAHGTYHRDGARCGDE